MISNNSYESSPGNACYLPDPEETGKALALVVRRDFDEYFYYARDQGLRIACAADTRQQQDYLTGITRLESDGPLELLSATRTVPVTGPGRC